MPKNLKQEIIYTVMMVVIMVYGMVVYNVALNTGGLQDFAFMAAFHELPIMGAIGFILDMVIAGPIAKKAAFKLFQPGKDKPIFIILAISVFSIWIMCPLMSLAATLLFKGGLQANFISIFIQTIALNFPVAFFWQLFGAGPMVRFVFNLIPFKD